MQQKQTPKEKTARALTPELRRRIILLGVKILGILLIFYILLFRIYGFVRINTNMMMPSVKGGDLALVYHIAGDYAIGDIVEYRCENRTCFGRIIAKEGDEISLKEGKILINGHLEDTASYGDNIFPEGGSVSYPYKVASEQYFIVGDNRNEYDDSRSFGAINKSEIVSKIIGVFRTHDI
jgi:signal peptidase I